jgi:hypothetical protein
VKKRRLCGKDFELTIEGGKGAASAKCSGTVECWVRKRFRFAECSRRSFDLPATHSEFREVFPDRTLSFYARKSEED